MIRVLVPVYFCAYNWCLLLALGGPACVRSDN